MTTETMQTTDFIADELKKYNLADAEIAKKAEEYLTLKIINLEDSEGYEVVKKAALEMRTWRTGVEKIRKGLKQTALDYGRAVDGEAKRITLLIAPIEAHLVNEKDQFDQENERIRLEAIALKQLPNRMEKLASIGIIGMDEPTDEGQQILIKTGAVSEDQIQRLEEFLLAIDDAKFFVYFSDQHDAHMEAQRVEQEKAATKLQEDQKKLEDEKKALADEKTRQIDLKAAGEKAAEKERQRMESERLAEAERARLAKEKAAAEAAAAPDKEKLLAFAKNITDNLVDPQLNTEDAKQILADAIGLLYKVEKYIVDNVQKL